MRWFDVTFILSYDRSWANGLDEQDELWEDAVGERLEEAVLAADEVLGRKVDVFHERVLGGLMVVDCRLPEPIPYAEFLDLYHRIREHDVRPPHGVIFPKALNSELSGFRASERGTRLKNVPYPLWGLPGSKKVLTRVENAYKSMEV